jgi:hypothetical protein
MSLQEVEAMISSAETADPARYDYLIKRRISDNVWSYRRSMPPRDLYPEFYELKSMAALAGDPVVLFKRTFGDRVMAASWRDWVWDRTDGLQPMPDAVLRTEWWAVLQDRYGKLEAQIEPHWLHQAVIGAMT